MEAPRAKVKRTVVNKKATPLLEISNLQPNQWYDHESYVSHRSMTYQVLEQNESKRQLRLLAVEKKCQKKKRSLVSWC